MLTDNPLPWALLSREPGLKLYYYLTDNLSQGPCSISRRFLSLLFIVITLEGPKLQCQTVRSRSKCLVVLTNGPGLETDRDVTKRSSQGKPLSSFRLNLWTNCIRNLEGGVFPLRGLQETESWFFSLPSEVRGSFYVSLWFSFSQVYGIKWMGGMPGF